eukprot:1161955-Pelagomonas_calceolata.AAC.16
MQQSHQGCLARDMAQLGPCGHDARCTADLHAAICHHMLHSSALHMRTQAHMVALRGGHGMGQLRC